MYYWIIFAAALLFCIVGFKEFVWFMSVGYGLSVCGIGIANLAILLIEMLSGSPILGIDPITDPAVYWVLIAQSVLFIGYGIRLGGFLLIRELKNTAYKKTLQEASGAEPPIFVKVVMWLLMGALYLAQTAGLNYKVHNFKGGIILPIIGIAISLIGVILEATADKQKSAQKKTDPNMVATKGLFKLVRCPNYFGEVTFWTGTFISGMASYRGVGQWIVAIIGYIAIVYIMFNGCQRLDKRQTKRLGGDPVFEEYATKTPILIPFIPWYYHCDPKEVAKEAKMDHAKKLAKEFEAQGK